MSVYVDQIVLHPNENRILFQHSCHLFADTTEELLDFAVLIGMQARWIQDRGTYREHFDLTPRRREIAVAQGAIEITTKEWLRRKRDLPQRTR